MLQGADRLGRWCEERLCEAPTKPSARLHVTLQLSGIPYAVSCPAAANSFTIEKGIEYYSAISSYVTADNYNACAAECNKRSECLPVLEAHVLSLP